MRQVVLIILASLIFNPLFAQDTTNIVKEFPQRYYTTSAAQKAPVIDGIIDEECWGQVEWSGDFTQREPNKGALPSQKTAFKVLYDSKNIYFAIRAYDTEPGKISKRMSRRDSFDGDFVEVNIDSYFDHRTAFSFSASASGVKGDEAVSNNGENWDSDWDPIWYLKTSFDDEGWIAEIRIPLSQLRFADKPVHTWGLQVMRNLFREQERSVWKYIAPDAPGYVHLFGELDGIEGVKPQHQLEIQPFVLGKMENFKKEEGNPFADGKDQSISVGVDGKVGITSDVTLDFTINPDFGQVEADPSQVNLSAYQIFFRERRPFFVEGNNILTSPLTQSAAGGPFNSDNLFYSRRIGGGQHHNPDIADTEHIRNPGNTTILGAVKLTGKNKKGFSWGLLESVTSKETAEIDLEGKRRKETVEPITNFMVGRFQQDLNQGKTVFGGMITAVNRKITDSHLEFLHKNAYSGGMDINHFFKDRKYNISGNLSFSHVMGTTEAITITQKSSTRFFQRPDARHVTLDTNRTSLSGTSGTVKVGKTSGNIIFQSGFTWRSPGYELNDAGFLHSADFMHQWAWAQYRKLQPFAIFRSMRLNVNEYLTYDFGGTNTYKALNTNIHTQLKNFWNLGTGGTLDGGLTSNADLRGGPGIRYPGAKDWWYYFGSDSRKKISFQMEHYNKWGNENFSRQKSGAANISLRPVNALNISLGVNMSLLRNDMQYVNTKTYNEKDQFITATINQETFGMELRFTYMITPNLSIQYWGQPFISKGKYSDFKYITDPKAKEYKQRFVALTPQQTTFNVINDAWDVDINQDQIIDYSINNPDFNFVEFRSNMVLRWEYIPGSTLFVVWNQGKSDNLPTNRKYEIDSLADGLREVYPHNIFLLKYTYRFVR